MSVKDRKSEGKQEKNRSQPACNPGQNIGGLCAENVFGHSASKRCTQPLAFRTLHQDDENHQQRDDDVEYEQDVYQKDHRDGQYGQSGPFVNRTLP